jgi:hypothetical protein
MWCMVAMPEQGSINKYCSRTSPGPRSVLYHGVYERTYVRTWKRWRVPCTRVLCVVLIPFLGFKMHSSSRGRVQLVHVVVQVVTSRKMAKERPYTCPIRTRVRTRVSRTTQQVPFRQLPYRYAPCTALTMVSQTCTCT